MNTKKLLRVMGCLMGWSLLLVPAALAQYQQPDRVTPTRTQGTSAGTRDDVCGQSPIALIPQGHMGQTISTHPTLVWQISNDTKVSPIKLRLYRYEGARKVFVNEFNVGESQPGIMAWTLPDEQPGLTVTSQYYWQVVITCNPNDPSKDLFDEGELEVVNLSEKLQSQLNQTVEKTAQARLYAGAGLWYDAWKIVALSTDPSAIELRRSLMEQVASSSIAVP